MAKLIAALVLVDLAAHQVKAGTLLEAQQDTINALAKAGEVDPHKDAVAHARKQGLPMSRSALELAAERAEQQADALKVEIAKLEQTLATASDDVKPAVQKQLDALRAELQQLA